MPISSYLKSVREKVGHDLLMMTAAAVLIFDAGGRLLLGKDAETGSWSLPEARLTRTNSPPMRLSANVSKRPGSLLNWTRLRRFLAGLNFLFTIQMVTRPITSPSYFADLWWVVRTDQWMESFPSSDTSVRLNAKAWTCRLQVGSFRSRHLRREVSPTSHRLRGNLKSQIDRAANWLSSSLSAFSRLDFPSDTIGRAWPR
jgi:hypothetical protein